MPREGDSDDDPLGWHYCALPVLVRLGQVAGSIYTHPTKAPRDGPHPHLKT